jgi:hypothetical protein
MRLQQIRFDLVFLFTIGLAASYAAYVSACSSSRADKNAINGSKPEDSLYASNLKKYIRDSVVLDSLTNLVNTDSLYKLYRRALEPAGADQALVQAVYCEETRLGLVHGTIPWKRAVARMLDTVYRDRGVKDAFRFFAARAPASGKVESGPCEPLPSPSPVDVNGTRTDVEPYRPQPPRV